MSALDLSGDIRFELEVCHFFSDGHIEAVNGLRIFVRTEKGRWVKTGGPIIATEDSDRPTRAQLLEAAARVVAAHDAGLSIESEL